MSRRSERWEFAWMRVAWLLDQHVENPEEAPEEAAVLTRQSRGETRLRAAGLAGPLAGQQHSFHRQAAVGPSHLLSDGSWHVPISWPA